MSEQLDPARDWRMLVLVAGIILLGLVAWNVWTFDTVARGGAIGPAPAVTAGFTPAAAEAVRAVFDARAAEETKYRTGAYVFSDPSLP